jgi:hypothetical protein
MRNRLMAAAAGLLLGAAIGVGISFRLLDANDATWTTRIAVGLIVGGIAAVLGLLFGLPQK